MNRIEDERIKFYLEHEEQIREWAGLEAEVSKFVDRFYRSLKGDLDAALRSGRIADSGVESFLVVPERWPDWPGVGLRRQGWPKSDWGPDVRLGWYRKKARFSADENLVCGVITSVERYRAPFTKEARPAFPRSSSDWAAYRNVDPPVGKVWEGENLKQYRNYLVETILKAWNDLAPLVDKTVGDPPR